MNLAAKMTLDTAGFVNPLSGAIGGLKRFLLTAAGVGGLAAGLKAGFDMGGELSDLHAQTGVAVSDLVVLRQAFDDAGVGAGQLPMSIQYMQRSLSGLSESGQSTERVFKALGLNMDELKGLSTTEQFSTIGAAINSLGNETDKTAAAMEIFGRSGAPLKQLFADPEAIKKAGAALGSLPAVLEKNADLMDSVGDSFGQLKTQAKGVFVGIASEMAPALSALTTELKSLDLTKVGQQAGRVIAIVTEAFGSGKLTDLVNLSITTGLQTAFSTLTKGDFWSGLADMAIGALASLQAFLMKIFISPINFLSAGLSKIMDDFMEWLGTTMLGDALGVGGYKAVSFEQHKADAARDNAAWTDQLSEDGAASLASGKAKLAAAWQDARDTITPEKEKLAKTLGEINAALDAKKDALTTATGKAPGGAPVNLSEKAPKTAKNAGPDVDSWAKVGLFVGAGGGPALDYNRRTAMATEKVVTLLSRSLSRRPQDGITLGWADA